MVQVTDLRGWIALAGLGLVILAALVWSILGSIPTVLQGSGLLVRQEGFREVIAPQPGIITEINVRAGDEVREGQTLAQLQVNPGSTIELKSPATGRIIETLVEKGSILSQPASIASLEVTGSPLKGLAFVALSDGKRLTPGMPVQLSPASVRSEEAGLLLGKVKTVSQFPVSAQNLLLQVRSKELAEALLANGPAIMVEIELEKASTPTGFKWTTQNGPRLSLTSGTVCGASIILGEQRPISLVLPVFQ
jgi:hypothetical protein